jgi:hypothetical protein
MATIKKTKKAQSGYDSAIKASDERLAERKMGSTSDKSARKYADLKKYSPTMMEASKKQKSKVKTKMKDGGSLSGLKASNKRVGPVDPKGAYTKVQKKTLAGAKGKASLVKDKQLGATKMKMGGKSKKH